MRKPEAADGAFREELPRAPAATWNSVSRRDSAGISFSRSCRCSEPTWVEAGGPKPRGPMPKLLQQYKRKSPPFACRKGVAGPAVPSAIHRSKSSEDTQNGRRVSIEFFIPLPRDGGGQVFGAVARNYDVNEGWNRETAYISQMAPLEAELRRVRVPPTM